MTRAADGTDETGGRLSGRLRHSRRHAAKPAAMDEGAWQ